MTPERIAEIYAEQTGFDMAYGHGSDIALNDFGCAVANEERERIAKIFDDMGLRPYAEIVRDSGKEKK